MIVAVYTKATLHTFRLSDQFWQGKSANTIIGRMGAIASYKRIIGIS
jgi:hypothetical protein